MEHNEKLAPSWWPYAEEFPAWQVWLGVDNLCYARRLGSSPPIVVRGEDPVDLRDEIRRKEAGAAPGWTRM